jgi:hypothetical protein
MLSLDRILRVLLFPLVTSKVGSHLALDISMIIYIYIYMCPFKVRKLARKYEGKQREVSKEA